MISEERIAQLANGCYCDPHSNEVNVQAITSAIRIAITEATAAERASCASIVRGTRLTMDEHKYPSLEERTLIEVVETGCRGAFAEAIMMRGDA